MTKLHTYESFLNEAKKSKKLNSNERSVLLLDGTGSAGKSFTLKEIGAKKPNKGEKVGDDDYEVIAFDDYFPHGEGVSMSDPKDPANQKRWQLEEEAGIPKEAREWAKKSGDFACNAAGYKKMFQESANARTAILKKLKTVKNPTKEEVLKAAGEKIGNDGDMSKEDFDKMDPKEALKSLIDTQEKKIAYNQKIADETPDYKHPDMPEGEFAARWYMAQQYKKSTAKNVVFDDVEPNINKFLPKGTVKTVLLHSDPDKLGSNIASREKSDPRNPEYVFNDYLNKYEFVKEKPKDGEGDPGKPTTRAKMEKTLKGLTKSAGLSLSTVNDDYIKNWLSKAGMNDDGTYYMKVRGEYLKEVDPILLNSDKDGDYLKKFKQIAEEEEKRVKEGKKKVEGISDEESKEDIKTIEDTGTSHLFSGIDPKVAKKMKEVKVNIRMPNKTIKSITIETLMDFVPIDIKDPEENVMVKAQQIQYEKINEIRIKQKLKQLIDFKIWVTRNVELAKDNKDYQARIKAKTLAKMNKAKAGAKAVVKAPVKAPVKESYNNIKNMKHIHTFESFLNESELNEARAVAVTVKPEMFGKTLQKFYKVRGETNTWRVHSEYYNDQNQANNSSDRDVIYFEAMTFPTGKIIIGAGLINNLTGSNAGTLGKTFGTTVDEFKADPKKVCKEAADLILSADQQKIFSKLAKSQGQTFKFKLDGDFSTIIQELIENSIK